MLGDVYAGRGIRPHFDVGKIEADDCVNHPGYRCLGVVTHTDWVDDYTLPVGTDPNQPNKISLCHRVWRGRRDHHRNSV